MNIEYNDGGRVKAGFKGGVADCVTRAIAIASDRPYLDVWDDLRSFNPDGGINTLSAGFIAYMRLNGFVWFDACKGITVDDFPAGRFVAWVQGHYTAIIDRTIQDVEDASLMPVLGYWLYAAGQVFDVYENGRKVYRYPLTLDAAVNMQRLFFLNYKRSTVIK